MNEITSITIIHWQNELMESCKASSVKKYRNVFNGILEDAYKERVNGHRMILFNPFREVDIPKERETFLMKMKIFLMKA